MKGGVRFYLVDAVMLLALAGCTHGASVAVPGEDSYAAADRYDDLSRGEPHFRQANFGLRAGTLDYTVFGSNQTALPGPWTLPSKNNPWLQY